MHQVIYFVGQNMNDSSNVHHRYLFLNPNSTLENLKILGILKLNPS